MTTQPTAATDISVIAPVEKAFEHMKRVLFQPFDIGKWFVIGFCAWLAQLGESGGTGGFNQNFGGSDGGSPQERFRHAKDYVMSNLHWIIPVVIAVVVLCIVLWVVFTWLNSRGRFMLLHCVALNKAEIAVPWNGYGREANSLFVFRMVLMIVGTVVTLPFVAVTVLLVLKMIGGGGGTVALFLILAALIMVFVVFAVLFGIIGKFTTDFVVPIMYLRKCSCMDGWRELRGLISANVVDFIVYLIFQIVMALIIGVGILVFILVTCCIAGCIMAIPYIGTVLLLPVYVFSRGYSAYYLAQFGTGYDVFLPNVPPAGLQPIAGAA